MTRELSIDIETYSSEDLSRSGVYRYAEAPDFAVLLFGYSLDGGPVSVVDIASGEKVPSDILSLLMDESVLKWAFNAAFERVCLSRFLRDLGLLPAGAFLSPASWRCSMVWCGYLGLPMSLAGAGEALMLDQQKLTEGKDLIRYFCRPAKVTLLSQDARNMPWSDPARWRQFKEYNRRDVEVERDIKARIRNHPVPEAVWEEYFEDQLINDRGIRVNLDLVDCAIRMDDRSHQVLAAQMKDLTSLENPGSVLQVRSWLEEHGQRVESLGKKQVAELLQSVPEEIRDVLLLHQQLSKSSVRKYNAIQNSVCADGRVRGMFQFYGAARSGRWAGRGVQLQNLPQNHLEPLGEARQLVLQEDDEMIDMIFGSVPDVLSELIRTAFVPSPGKKFIVADFSAIEARVIAWLAGEFWRQQVFADGKDIYCASASQMFHVPVEKHGVNGHLRQKGKIAELALGYGGSVGALRAMGALEMGVQEKELQPLVDAWRRANPNIVRLWWNVDKMVKTAIRNKTTLYLNGLKFSYHSRMLFITLPSGRSLSYVKPELHVNPAFGSESVRYLGLNAARKWGWVESYGPKFVENIVQGISRDLLCNAMYRLMDLNIVAHVHDELIIEADPDLSVDAVCREMAAAPPWAQGLLLRADGYECEDFYRKD
jgi:DNA polymerase